ncbi:glycosyltransferase family 2 protein [Laspinema olomoucense]|uniref:Glycosyltransferase n=1 Tax=Laspinema olomoucense D3b TaxID=2953688 RepID=A0ABT2N3Y2_9CYAN|nr:MULTISPECIES: glycosyltransferase family 2 protein [unclassified Laspinema]MCT7977395.1 glycosyltransferase [Laspinema sp. D3b]MCT7986814.1 glycosyltransferase [Laspinema sp. D3a]
MTHAHHQSNKDKLYLHMSIPKIEYYCTKLERSQPYLKGGRRLLPNCNNEEKCHPEKPLVSIVTVVYNAEMYLEKTIQSVINQTYENIEYIIIDGGSQDLTLEIIKKYEEKISYWISESDLGIYDAMNKGIALCKGDIIGIMNAGDIYTTEAVSTVINSYENSPISQIIVGNCKVTLDFEHSKWVVVSGKIDKLPYKTLPHPSVFVTLSVYKEQGLYNTSFRIAGDYDFLCRCFNKKVKFIHVDTVIAIASQPGLSSNYYLNEAECLRVRLQNHLPFYLSIFMSIFSFVTITLHKILANLGLWAVVESRRHGTIR